MAESSKAHGIPSLDGLRAMSILLVVLAHLGGTRGFPVSAATMNYFALGNLGVRVFFVISGFLITTLLLDEMKAHDGRIDLGRFYLRRTFRIFPPYFVFLGVVIALTLTGAIAVSSRDVLHAMAYVSNYNSSRSWYVGHTWSLAVEEQFYLLWPAILVVLGRSRGLRAAAWFVVLAPVIRLGIWYFVPSYQVAIGTSFETVGDAIACGCVLAGRRDRLWANAWYRRLVFGAGPYIALLVIVAGSALEERPRIFAAVGATAMNVAIAVLIDSVVRVPYAAVGRLFNTAVLKFVGVLSYSIYLWQQLFLNRGSSAALAAFPLNVAALSLVALASFYLVERPSLRIRSRLEAARARRQQDAVPCVISPNRDAIAS